MSIEFHADPYFPRQQRTRLDFLVYGECVCGWHCACPEGAQWPECPVCENGNRARPRRDRGLNRRAPEGFGYVAHLMLETEAVKKAAGAGYIPARTMFSRVHDPDNPVFDDTKALSADVAVPES